MPFRRLRKKQTGSYTITFESGKKYHGKGNENRMKQSAREKEKKYGDRPASMEWTPAENDRQAFIGEYKRLKADGGPSNPNNYNKIESPGKKMSQSNTYSN